MARALADKLAPVLNVTQPLFIRIIKYLLHTHSLWFARVRVESDRLEECLHVRALKDDRDAALVASAQQQHSNQETFVTQETPLASAEIDDQSVATVMEVAALFLFFPLYIYSLFFHIFFVCLFLLSCFFFLL